MRDVSLIRNKQKRSEVFHKRRTEAEALKRERKLKRKREEQELGKDAPPKQTPKTIENTRIEDMTKVKDEENEIELDEKEDEFHEYFDGTKKPKIMLTTRPRPSRNLFPFMSDMMMMMPNTFYYPRKKYELRDMLKWAYNKKFTHLIVLGEKRKRINQMLLCHLPDGPCALFKVSSVKQSKDIRHHGASSFHVPEIILNRFTTRLGRRLSRLLGSMYSHKDPEYQGRNVVTFHNQRDFIFVRHHRYMFRENGTRAALQELGPRFTLRLRWLMAGNFDPMHGEYEWLLRRKEMETSRRKFVL